MNTIKKFFPMFLLLVVSLFCLIGCCIPINTISDATSGAVIEQKIISEHVMMYSCATNSQSDDIFAILREFSNRVITNEFRNWQQLIDTENEFVSELKTNYISLYYTVVPSDEEIYISDSFLDHIIEYDKLEHPDWIYRTKERIPNVSAAFITQMSDYEYSKRDDR